MKRWISFIALAGLLSGCAFYKTNFGAGMGPEPSQGAPIGARGTTGVSTGADTGSFITGSESTPR